MSIPCREDLHPNDSDENIARRVESKCADGDIGGALRVLTSTETLAAPTEETLATLRMKHPLAPDDEVMPSPPTDSDSPSLTVTEDQVRRAILSMPTGSSGGLDGVRPLHLRQLTATESMEAGKRLLTALTSLCNLVLAGKVPQCARDGLFSASLCALRKKDGGIRPIAVGSALRRLPARIAARAASDLPGLELRPVQLGIGTQQGCEAAVHGVREFVTSSEAAATRIVVKVDVRNAFNSVRRDAMLSCVRDRCPALFPMIYQAYFSPTPLLIGEDKIWSATGVQQGDPLGPLCFALAVDRCARSLTAPLNVWYLDDATIGGSVTEVTNDLKTVVSALQKIGLQLNSSKCEVTVLDNPGVKAQQEAVQAVKMVLPDITETPLTRLQLLGSPLHDAGISTASDTARDTITRLCRRVKLLDRHTGLFFLAHYVSAPRLTYLLRSAPLFKDQTSLKHIDELVRSTLSEVTNVDVSGAAWAQAALPLRHGGLGVRSVEMLALPSYIASLHAATQLTIEICPTLQEGSRPSLLLPAVAELQNKIGSPKLPEGPDTTKQKKWDDLVSVKIGAQLLQGCNQVDRARLLAASKPHTAAWLQAIPVPSLGLHLDADTVRIAVALRLGSPVCEPHPCRLCHRQVEQQGLHGLSCAKSAGRLPRHGNLNDVVKRSLASAGLPSILEPLGLDRGDGKRPDGLTLFPFKRGKALAWDATCVDTFASSSLIKSAIEPGSASKSAELRKCAKYEAITDRHIFVPVAAETTGVLGPSTTRFLAELGTRISAVTGDKRESEWLFQRLSMAIIRGNAAAVLSTAGAKDSEPRRVEKLKLNPGSSQARASPAASEHGAGVNDGADEDCPPDSLPAAHITLACVEDSQEASDGYLSAEPATPGPAAPEQTPLSGTANQSHGTFSGPVGTLEDGLLMRPAATMTPQTSIDEGRPSERDVIALQHNSPQRAASSPRIADAERGCSPKTGELSKLASPAAEAAEDQRRRGLVGLSSNSDICNNKLSTRRSADAVSRVANPTVCPPAVNPSRNPLDDPELARYLLPTSQELTEQLLCITPSATHTPGPSRPMALAGYAALLAEMKEGI